MKTEEVKKLAKEKYGKVLTDEEAEALLERLNAEGELSEDDLENVAGGIFPPLSGRKFPKMPD